MESVSVPDTAEAALPLNLLLAWPEERSRASWALLFGIGACVQAVFFAVLLNIASIPIDQTPERQVVVHKTPLYFPRDLLTQRAPNRQRPAENVKLSDLQPSPPTPAVRPTPPPSVRHVEVPKAPAVTKPAIAAPTEPPPNLTAKEEPPRPPQGATNGLPAAPPPVPQPKVEQPFEDIGSDKAPYNPHPTLHVPKAGLDGASEAMPPTQNARRMVVTDQSFTPRLVPGAPGSGLHSGPSQHVEVELKSDSDAPDFRAYLARILSVVRGNWRLVTPESVRMGTLRGENTIELIIDRNGNIPKLVIGRSSNSPALDQASIAGVSMSNPLPPLPADIKEEQVRLAFTFKYNVQE